MGDLVLTEDEVAPVMRSLVQNGIEVTAVHNHILRASPSTLYMHIAGMGDPVKLAQAIHGALGKSRTPLEAAPAAEPALDLDAAALHMHVLAEEPRLYFMHFWGVDDPRKLASGLRAALDRVNIARSQTSEVPAPTTP